MPDVSFFFFFPFKWKTKKQEKCENNVKFILHPTRGKGKCTFKLFIDILFRRDFSGTSIFRLFLQVLLNTLPYSTSGEARGLVNVNIRDSSLLNISLYFIYLGTSPSESSEIAPLWWLRPPQSTLTACIQSATFSSLSCCFFCRAN